MQSTRKGAALTLSAALALTLTGCGGNDGAATPALTETPAVAAEAPTPETEAPVEPEPDPVASVIIQEMVDSVEAGMTFDEVYAIFGDVPPLGTRLSGELHEQSFGVPSGWVQWCSQSGGMESAVTFYFDAGVVTGGHYTIDGRTGSTCGAPGIDFPWSLDALHRNHTGTRIQNVASEVARGMGLTDVAGIFEREGLYVGSSTHDGTNVSWYEWADSSGIVRIAFNDADQALGIVGTGGLRSVSTTLRSNGVSLTQSWSDLPSEGTAASDTQCSPSSGLTQARESARGFLALNTGFSRSSLIAQLEFRGFSNDAATCAADSVGANWYDQAVLSAEGFLALGTGFSRSGLIGQLEFGGFTNSEATHGTDTALSAD